jgi:hypothetical protein
MSGGRGRLAKYMLYIYPLSALFFGILKKADAIDGKNGF